MRIISYILTFLLIILGIAFAALNAKAVEINYLIGSKELPLAIVLLVALTIGVLLSVLLMGVSMIKLKAKNTWLENKLRRSQEHQLQQM